MPAVLPEPYTVGSFAKSKTIDYDAQPRKEPSIFERIAQMRAERVRGAAPPAEETPEAKKEREAAAEAGIKGAKAPTRQERRVASQRYTQRAMAIEGAEAGVPEQAPTAAGAPSRAMTRLQEMAEATRPSEERYERMQMEAVREAREAAERDRVPVKGAEFKETEIETEAVPTAAPAEPSVAPTEKSKLSIFKRLQRNGARRIEPTTSGVA